MPALSARGPLLLVGVASLAALAVCAVGTGRGAPPTRQGGPPALAPARAGGARPDLVKRFNPAGTCTRCHNVAEGTPNPPANTPQYQLPALVRLDEYRIWNEQDKHRGAYAPLLADRGKRIGQALGINVAQEKACLACHAPAGLIDTANLRPQELDERKMEGVSCVSCHGPYDEWVRGHWDVNVRWRDRSMAEKERDFGLAPLRDPVGRARACLSCHVGDADEGKVLTHEMYAAGHPPLQAFETASFSRAEPPHWWAPKDVPAFQGKDDDAKRKLLENFHVDLSGLQDSKLALLGGVAALRASMALVAAQARADQGGTAWPDYARFECYSCHHDLKSPGYQQWRQVRGYGRRLDGRVIPGQAGRPQLRLWPAPLTWLALTQAGGDRDGLTAALRGLQEAIDAQVFGAPSDVEREARNLAAWADRFLARNDVETIGQDDLLGLLRALATLPPAAYPDYDSARQIAWAIDVIDSERDPKPAGARGAAIRPILNRLRQQLKLDPFEARDDWARASRDLDPGEIPAAHQRFSDNELVRALISAAEYDPTLFRSNLGRLLQALPDR